MKNLNKANTSNKRTEQKPLTLRGWEYNQSGKPIDAILHESFMHFYLTSASQKPCKNTKKQTVKNT